MFLRKNLIIKLLCFILFPRILYIEIFYTNNDALQGGVLSIVSKKIDSDSLAEKLGSAGICVRAGLHCAPMAHETAGTLDTGTVRFSFSPFNKQEEIDLTARILKKTLNN